jgi:ABC-type glutathione transport system ATPase component
MSVALSARDLHLVRRSASPRFELHVDALDISSGEVLAILGPNGAGKSTLLKTLAGLEPPDSGQVVCSADGPVTMVFQRPIALAGSVLHNVKVVLRAAGVDAAETERRSLASLSHFGIADLIDRRAARLSGGELRRLALARAFALAPQVLLLDEPFDDLDAGAQESLSRDLRAAITQTGVAVAVVTHDLRRAVLISDRIAVLQDGRIRQQGEREAVLMSPVDVAVAELVGMTNLLPASVGPDGVATLEDGSKIPTTSRPSAEERVWIGIRPEHLKVDIGRGEGLSIGEGIVREHVSDGVLTTLTIAFGEATLRTHLVSGRGMARELGVGDRVSLSLRPEDVHVLSR